MIELETERLVLRRWTDRDRAAFHRLNADPAVMATIGPTMTRQQSDSFFDLIVRHFDLYDYGLWCVELEGDALGFTGLLHPSWRDGLEIGWRLRSEFWGQGFAPEAASAVLDHAFGALGFDEIISFTARINHKSLRVMQKIGLSYDSNGDFEHPNVAVDSPLRPHLLYRLDAAEHRLLRESESSTAVGR